MGLFSKKDKPIKCKFMKYDGISGINMPAVIEILLNHEEKRLEISLVYGKREPILLEFSQIKNVSFVSEKKMVEKSKSVVGRAVAGGVLLGPLGAVVGGASGIGDKKKETTTYFIEIEYMSKNSKETKTITLGTEGASFSYSKLFNALKSEANIKKEQSNYL